MLFTLSFYYRSQQGLIFVVMGVSMFQKLVIGFSRLFLVSAFVLFFQSFVNAEVSEESLEQDIDNLGAEVDGIARDIALLERELLFPPLTRVQFYLSVNKDVQFTLQSLTLLLDGEEKSFHIYFG